MGERSATESVRRLGRSALSVGLLLAVAIGIPIVARSVAQARFGGANPLTGVAPPWEWSPQALTDRLTDEAVVDVVLRVGLVSLWAAAAVLLVTTVTEVVHLVRHRGLSMPSVRGLGWAQPVARFIAAGLVLLLPLASSAATVSGVVATPSPATSVAPVPLPTSDASTPTTTARPAGGPEAGDPRGPVDHHQPRAPDRGPLRYVVQAGDSVYAIATAHAAGADDVLRVADEIIEANLGRPMGDGQRFTTPAYVEPGWVLEIPGAAATPTIGAESTVAHGPESTAAPEPESLVAHVHVVAEGDTLWDIAADRLGDPLAWTSIWASNAGRTMVDGRVFDDPDLIVPGWVLELGDVPATAGESAPPATTRLDVEPSPEPVVPVPGAERVKDTTATEVTALPGTSAPNTATPDTTTPTSGDHASGDVDTTAVPSPTDRPGPARAAESTVASTTGAPVIGDAGGTTGDDPDSATPAPLRLEHAALIAAGILAIVGVARRRRLRTARPRHRIPEPPPAVHRTERRLRSIDGGERAERIDVACRAVAASIADTGHRIGWIAVDELGALRLRTTGDVTLPPPWTGDAAAWQLGAEVPVELLAPDARRADMPCMALVQLGVTNAGEHLLVDLEACGQLDVDAPGDRADQVVTALALGLASSVHAEVAHLIGASLPPEALLGHRNAHRVPDARAAVDLATTLVGSTGDHDQSTFQLRTHRTGGEMWEPAVVFLTSTDDVDDTWGPVGNGVALVTAGAAAPSATALTAEAGTWCFRGFGDVVELRPIGVSDDDLTAVTELLADADRALDPIDELQWADDPHESDPDPSDGPVTQDCAVPFVDREHEVVVRLLGGVTITTRTGDVGVFERSKTVELIAWLATHRDRSTRSGARTAMWDLDVRDATFANVVSEARRGLARLVPPPEGEEWVGRTLSDALPLHDLVVTDADLVADRLARARLEPPAQAVDTLRPAVALIRDLPFAGANYLWPDAEGLTSNLVLLAIGAATEYAAHALSLGDVDGVFWATGQGLKVLPGHEGLIGLRMQAHARAGDLAGVRQEWASYERVLIGDPWSDGEPAPELVALRRELLDT